MEQLNSTPLNAGQKAAAEGFFEFLFGPQKELILSGGGGVGKTYLMGHLIDEVMPQYLSTCRMMGITAEYVEVQMTATTNKAAEVLAEATGRPSETVHAFFNLKVQDDFSTGRSTLTKGTGWKVHKNLILFIDECSMIDSALRRHILEGTYNCKIIYVGDHCQLAPVFEEVSPIYRDNLPFYELTEPMRNRGQQALMDVCRQLRYTVESGHFMPIQIVPGVIDLLDGPQMEQAIGVQFAQQTHESRILAYSNKQVIAYNEHIRGVRQLPTHYVQGEFLVNNNAIRQTNGMMRVEEEVEIESQSAVTVMEMIEEDVELEVRSTTLLNRYGVRYTDVPVPEDRDHFIRLINWYKSRKNWNRYFYLKNNFPDLRQRDAATVHKAQGSSYDTVFIDLENLSTCHQPNTAARLLYVAFSRARQRVVLYGNLAEKYGGLIQ